MAYRRVECCAHGGYMYVQLPLCGVGPGGYTKDPYTRQQLIQSLAHRRRHGCGLQYTRDDMQGSESAGRVQLC